MSIDTRTEAERRYDAERNGTLYSKPEPAEQARSPLYHELKAWIDQHLDSEPDPPPVMPANPSPLLLDLVRWADAHLAREAAEATPISPAVLDVATARQLALADWKGRTKIVPSGALHRYPQLPEVEIGQLEDGTPVLGDFDTDDTPLCVIAEWEGFGIVAGEDGFDMGDQEGDKEYHHFTLDQWENLKNLVNSGVIDQMLYFGRAWEAQRHSTPPAPVAAIQIEAAPAPVDTLDPNDINVKAGGAAAVLTFLLCELDTDRAERLIALIETVEQAPATQRDQMVDALLAAGERRGARS
jgi:hypothetical protein